MNAKNDLTPPPDCPAGLPFWTARTALKGRRKRGGLVGNAEGQEGIQETAANEAANNEVVDPPG